MKQILQDLTNGSTSVNVVPSPGVSRERLIIQTRRTLISAGTEKMLVEFGQAGLIGKARAQPEKVKQVIEKIRTDGLLPTLDAVFAKLGEPLPLGYCNAGVVVEVGSGVTEFAVGDRVV
ncbi:MAG: alcohol dehydrogenase catalytic domain-containing protein [Pirellula sp.]